jgi:hypothetical protein
MRHSATAHGLNVLMVMFVTMHTAIMLFQMLFVSLMFMDMTAMSVTTIMFFQMMLNMLVMFFVSV